jgi:hypothetical protein
MNIKQIITTILSKLQFLNKDQSLNLEVLMIWVFLFITAFRALFAGVTLTIGKDIKWTILDSNIATSLPVLYSLLSQAHKNYLNLQFTKGNSNGQSNQGSN